LSAGFLNVVIAPAPGLSFNVEHPLSLSVVASVFQGKEVAACVVPKHRTESLKRYDAMVPGKGKARALYTGWTNPRSGFSQRELMP